MVNSFLVIFVSGSSFTRGFTDEKIADYKKSEAQISGLKQQATTLKDENELLKLTRALIAEYVGYLMQEVRSRLEGEVSRLLSMTV